MAGADREVELKYAVDDTDAVRELVAGDVVAGLRGGPWRSLEIEDRYIDTYRRALARAGYGARLRRVGRDTTLTVKAEAGDGAGGALHDRLELEGPANGKLDPASWPTSEARALLLETVGPERLRTQFTVRQNRVERHLLDDSGEVAATLSLDEAQVVRRGKSLGSFAELEVEAARPAGAGRQTLERVAAILEGSGLVRPEARSKQRIGLEMVAAIAAPSARPPRTPGVSADDTMAEAGRKVLRQHLLRMLAAEEATRSGSDVEAVHKMRVATRRMRAAWRVFDGAYRARLQRRYVDELRAVAGSLGAVRDMDVQIQRLAAFSAAAGPTAQHLDPLLADWQAERAAALNRIHDVLGSTAYERFVADYLAFVDTPGAGSAGTRRLVRDAAAGRIWRAYERLRAHDALLPYADAAGIHQVRIDTKRLRYTLEFFREVLPKTADPLIAQLVAQQDHLGLAADANVAAAMTREWLVESAAMVAPETRRAVGVYLAASEREEARLHRSFGRLWRRVAGRPFRRRLALVVSEV